MSKVQVVLDPKHLALESRVEVETTKGGMYTASADILQQIPSLDVKRDRIRNKALDLCQPVLGKDKTRELLRQMEDLETVRNMKSLAANL
jgi:hypothetical protein